MVLPTTGGELRVGVAVVTKSMVIVRLAVTVMLTVLDVMPPEDAVAVLVIEPASMSDWVIVCGKEEHHPEGNFYLHRYEGDKEFGRR